MGWVVREAILSEKNKSFNLVNQPTPFATLNQRDHINS